ncbi:hypothetical protein ABT160_29005 [Streptomyces sp. NPDC001941]|uniref:hypothetical protein n=1 Tax=Streptomyces sp. NPDC001941 TaxID=3154659 RepID=UPI003317F827
MIDVMWGLIALFVLASVTDYVFQVRKSRTGGPDAPRPSLRDVRETVALAVVAVLGVLATRYLWSQ